MKHLKDSIKESQINEGMDKSELIEISDQMKEELGADELLEAIIRAMGVDELRDNLKYICRMYELKHNIN